MRASVRRTTPPARTIPPDSCARCRSVSNDDRRCTVAASSKRFDTARPPRRPPVDAIRDTYRDPDRPLDARVGDLLGRLTLAEKVGLLHQHQAAVPRLGIGPFRTGTEALHGLAWLGPAT